MKHYDNSNIESVVGFQKGGRGVAGAVGGGGREVRLELLVERAPPPVDGPDGEQRVSRWTLYY